MLIVEKTNPAEVSPIPSLCVKWGMRCTKTVDTESRAILCPIEMCQNAEVLTDCYQLGDGAFVFLFLLLKDKSSGKPPSITSSISSGL